MMYYEYVLLLFTRLAAILIKARLDRTVHTVEAREREGERVGQGEEGRDRGKEGKQGGEEKGEGRKEGRKGSKRERKEGQGEEG